MTKKNSGDQINLLRIKELLQKYHLTGWLIYQCQGTYEVGLNPMANDICGIRELITRPWFCYLELARRQPIWIFQAMEAEKFTGFVGEKVVYSSRKSFVDALKMILPKKGKVAMEITEKAEIPLLSRVDFGTVSLIQSLTKAKIVSSCDLVGDYLSQWGKGGLASHKQAVSALLMILDKVRRGVKNNLGRITDYELQQLIEKLYQKYHLTTIYHPVVACGPDTGNPHYFPSADKPKIISRNQLLLIDIWGKTKDRGSVYADVTTMFYSGKRIPPKILKAWRVLIKARDAVLEYITKNISRRKIKGREIDLIARKIIEKAGFGQYFVHRVGHNIASELHGYGPNLDGYETIDDRALLLDTGYSIEPGIYTPEFGLRSEINVYISEKGKVELTTPKPKEIERI